MSEGFDLGVLRGMGHDTYTSPDVGEAYDTGKLGSTPPPTEAQQQIYDDGQDLASSAIGELALEHVDPAEFEKLVQEALGNAGERGDVDVDALVMGYLSKLKKSIPQNEVIERIREK